jgi:hypothetical protein
MIFHQQQLNNVDPMVKFAVELIHKNVAPLDVFVVASDRESTDRIERMEVVAKGQFTKPSWTKMTNKSNGVIFFVTSNQFRRRATKPILEVMEAVKKEIEGLTLESFDHAKFTAYFVGIKPKKEKTEEPIAEPTADDPQSESQE